MQKQDPADQGQRTYLGKSRKRHTDTIKTPVTLIYRISTRENLRALVNKYASAICKSIDERFPVDSCKVISAFSIFDIDMLPGQGSPEFHVFEKDEILVLAKQFFPDATDSVLNEWEDFRYDWK